ncbi:MAG: hlyD [Rhodospirillales bacterium]|nr:hlyD [Rhodospirillales bacterium]
MKRWRSLVAISMACPSLVLGGSLQLRPALAAIDVPAIAVSVGSVKRGDAPIFLTGLGTVQAFNAVTVRARVDGELTKIAFSDGQHVKAGDLLGEIDPRALRAQLSQTEASQAKDEAQLTNARLDLQRSVGLATKDYASKQTLDTQKAVVTQLEATVANDHAQVEYAHVQLGYATVVAPFDGVAGIRLIDQGNIVHGTDATGIVVISQIRPITVVFSIPEDELPDIKARMRAVPLTAMAFTRDGARQIALGQLSAIDNQVNQNTAMVKLKAVFSNEDESLWPGQFVQARLLLDTRRDVILAPTNAVRPGPDGPIAFVVDARRKVEVRHITLAGTSGDQSIIASGLAPGETVVTEGQFKLEAGSLVDPVVATPEVTAPGVATSNPAP